MSCFYPLKRWSLPNKFDNNEITYSFVVTSGKTETFPGADGFQEIPCGKCIGCRLDYSKQWADRCMLEAKQYRFNYMLTLTYDNENLPITKTDIAIDGSIVETSTVVKSDLKKFLDRVRTHWRRNYNHSGIRFFACGEYGELNGRAHYHILLFNFPVFDFQPMPESQKGFEQWTSPTIEKLWNKGRISLVNFNWNTAAYVARYVVKKQKGPTAKDYYENKGQIPEFVTMSTHPGIAKEYFDKNKHLIYETDEIFLPGEEKNRKVKPCRYFDKLYDLEEPEKMFEIKATRQERAEAMKKSELLNTDLKAEFYNKVKETNLIKRTQNLKRTI